MPNGHTFCPERFPGAWSRELDLRAIAGLLSGVPEVVALLANPTFATN